MNPIELKQKRAKVVLTQEDIKKRILSQRKTLDKIALKGIHTDEDKRIAQAVCCWFSAQTLLEQSLMEDKSAGDEYKTDLDNWLNELNEREDNNEI